MSLLRKHPLALLAAVTLHVGALALLSISVSSKPKSAAQPTAQVLEAVAVDVQQVEAALEVFREAEREKQRKIEAEKRRKEEARQAKIREEKRRVEEEKQRKVEAEQKRIAEIKKREEEAAKKKAAEEAAKKKAEEEKRRLAEQERQRKIEEEKQRKAEAERKAAAQKAFEDKLKAEMEAEDKRLADERQRERERVLARHEAIYASDISNKVRRNWLRPVGSSEDFSCVVLVTQMPTGDVISVRVLSSCGSDLLNRSVETAVRKASPLPAPPVPDAFHREIKFTFIP